MTRSELVRELATRRGLTLRAAEEVVSTVLGAMEQGLCEGRRIELRGFGSLRARHYPAYTGRNPRTSQRVEVQRKVLPVFKPGSPLLDRVNADPEGRSR